jgi:thiol-disulfide isomerase/thioredoxin
MKNRLLLIAGVAVLAGSIFFLYNKYRVAKHITVQLLSLTDLEGKPIFLDNFNDKNLFLNFFATWCGPCMQEMPALESAQANLQDENIHFILISDEPIAKLKSFRDQSGMSLTILHSERSLKEEQVFTLPTSYVLNKKREIVFDLVGVANWDSPAMLDKLRNALR